MKALTKKQQAFLDFLRGFVAQHGTFPSYKQIQDGMEYRSPNSVRQNLGSLHIRGLLFHEEGHGYSLEPLTYCEHCGSVITQQKLRRLAA